MFDVENEIEDLSEEELEGAEGKKEEKQVDENESISSKRLMKIILPISFLFQTVGVIIGGWLIGSWIATSESLFWGRSLFFLFLIAGTVRYVHLMTKEPPTRRP